MHKGAVPDIKIMTNFYMAYCSEVIIPDSLDLNIVLSHFPWDSYALVLIQKHNQSLYQTQLRVYN